MPFFKFLNAGQVVPNLFGAFHIVWLCIIAVIALALCILWKKGIIKSSSNVLLAAAIVVGVFELYKQINVIFGDGSGIGYSFEHTPIQYNTLLIFLGIIAAMTKNKIHDNLCAFIGTYLLSVGAYNLIYPAGLFSQVVGRNVQTMVSYGAMVVVGIFVWVAGEIKPEPKTIWKAFPIFFSIYGFSLTLNLVPHLVGWVFDFENLLDTCPICIVGEGASIPNYIFVAVGYCAIYTLVAFAVVLLAYGLKKLFTTDFDAEYGEEDELAKNIRKNTGLDVETEGIFQFAGKVNTGKNTYLQTYYKNLNTNFGNNTEGSCGYVAAAMLLSYYDTILHDKIVPRQFDKITRSDDEPNLLESPGIGYFDHPEFHPATPNDKISYKRYMELVNANKNTYLHEALISIGTKLGINKAPKDRNSTDFSFSTNNAEIEKVIEHYLKKVAGVKGSEYDIRECDNLDEISKAIKDKKPELVQKYSDQVRQYAIKNIKKGFPVLLGLHGEDNDGKSVGHSVVAYDYNEKTDEIYCHMGWGLSGATHARPEHVCDDVKNSPAKSFTMFKSARVLEFDEDNISHSHTNNYEVVINGAIFYYCPDGTYTTCDDLIVEFDKTKQNCAIIGVYGKYYKRELHIPEKFGNVNVVKIHEGALANQTHLDEISLPFSLARIEKNTFKNDKSLKTVIIPRTVTRIKKNAFKNCKNLKTIMFLGTKEQWRDIKKSRRWDNNTGVYVIRCMDGFLIKHNTSKEDETLV